MDHAGVTLLLWGPPPPSQQELGNKDKALAAQEAVAAYVKTCHEILQMPSALGSSQHALALHSWRRFLARWLAAVKASQGGAKGVHGGQGRVGRKPHKTHPSSLESHCFAILLLGSISLTLWHINHMSVQAPALHDQC